MAKKKETHFQWVKSHKREDVPKCYKSQPFDTSKADTKISDTPIINLADISNPTQRSILVQELLNACRPHGFFQVVNHGIPLEVLEGALSIASGFFNLATEDKAKYMSNDVHKPVRYGTSAMDGEDKVQFWRVFLKHYAHPLNQWIHMWPHAPHDYKGEASLRRSRLLRNDENDQVLVIGYYRCH